METASHIGIERDRAVTYRSDSEGTRLNYDVLSEAVTHVRMCGGIPMNWHAAIDEDMSTDR